MKTFRPKAGRGDEGRKKTERERYFEMCLIFTLGGRAKCDSSLNSSQSSLQVQPSTVELKPLSTWLKHGNTPCGVMGSVIKLLPHNGINYVEEQSKTFLAFAMLLNYFIWTNWASFAISDWDNYKLSMEELFVYLNSRMVCRLCKYIMNIKTSIVKGIISPKFC